ncbi:His-Xaa-Ser repeat protein HxsA [Thalassovita gelatinovora]|uniref:His-Xaa-Ser repeat protein HxsA n=1 Tax=Thalassovita gelatinovora TaxID=53501 RepID=A0A0P1G0D9_THAGE|nr:serine protease [Thalassovita gelatinovora]QIZ79976.1 peptidoglycan-binding protein [Thalassovita gelatinovora]CUH65625.1 His-Xaa-Ser repeat protein HxsA [Thalassovita gelatinovora]SER06011.1 Putative peptidoglycan binding domain-containing protein [Thalassovita gelatinovora]
MMKLLVSLLFAVMMMTRAALAQQDLVWVQIEAQPNLNTAQDRIRDYSSSLEDVNGFEMPGGWYAIALGPYARDDAEQVLAVLRAEGKIPRDAYIAFTNAYRQQFWPVGSEMMAQVSPVTPQGQTTPTEMVEPQPVVQQDPDETPAQARRSEAELSKDERMQLQVMLQWAGFYDSAIDGAFGRGTRRSMGDWQAAYGYDATGVLTTRQRAELERQYYAVLEGMDLQLVRDTEARIEMRLPLGVVKFSKYEAPFAHYDATGDIDAKVLLISQAGDQKTLFGLYDIMQTLEIVPLNGPRERDKDSFVLIGENAKLISHTQASLKDGHIKGFTLIWPAGDEERRKRILGLMQESFSRMDGVMSPAVGGTSEQSVDLLSGLEIRKPRLSRSGFFVDAKGTVVTTSEAVQNCTRITLEHGIEAEVIGRDDALGVAVLKPSVALAPAQVAALQIAAPRLQSDVAVSGYSYGGVLGAPTLTFGTLADLRGLSGEEDLARLALSALPGDVGGPVFDAGGAVMGMLLPKPAGGKQLPDDVSFALDAGAINGMLADLGLTPVATDTLGLMAPEDLTKQAGSMTVLVNCWY